MTHIKISKGLDIPIEGKPFGEITSLDFSQNGLLIALNLSEFDDIKFKILVQEGDVVEIGQPLAEDKNSSGRFFVSPAGGKVHSLRRGLKRRLLAIVIETEPQEKIRYHSQIAIDRTSRTEIIDYLKLGGLFTHIHQRPFNLLANPYKTPRSIFIKAVESAPFTPPAEMQVQGYEKEFSEGLKVLKKLTDGEVHLIHHLESTTFLPFKNAKLHAVEGPHPIANLSIAIEKIDPIQSAEDVIWTLNAHAVVAIGYLILHGSYFTSRIVSLAGSGIVPSFRKFYRLREGFPISAFLDGKVVNGVLRIISGDVLTGHQKQLEDFLGYEDTVVCVIPENETRKFMHFFRLGTKDFTKSGAYLTGHYNNEKREYAFTTSQHGEERPFIDSTLYDEVMPLNVPTMALVKSVLAEDFDLAVKLGLLEVDSEDFALPTFVCPSKIEMVEIIKNGLQKYANEMLK